VSVIRLIGTVRSVSAPFDAGRWVEVKVRMDNGTTRSFPCPAEDAGDYPVGQAVAITVETLLN
jgi:hypothetical protein